MARKKSAPKVRARSKNDPTIEAKDNDVHITIDSRHYRIRSLEKNTSPHQLRVNILATRDDLVHMDTFDLCKAKSRAAFIKATAAELFIEEQLIKKDAGTLLLQLEKLREQQIAAAMQPTPVPEMTTAERRAAMRLLRDPKLLEKVLTDYEKLGLVGEETNKLVGYLAATSRKLPRPLGVIIQSSSAAGKSTLMNGILSFVPPEEKILYSAMTGQSLYYMGTHDLAHKVLGIVEDAGAENASYALKLLQSEGELRIASTSKNQSGRMGTDEYYVEGPVMIFLTTTAIDIDEELMNRCFVLAVDESREQTAAIHAQQRREYTLEGFKDQQQRDKIIALHQNAQRLLRPLWVSNPYANRLTFHDNQTRLRRDHMKYLTLIQAVTLLHQHQRTIKTCQKDGQTIEYVEVTKEDIVIANRLADRILGRSIDELPPQTRRVLLQINGMVEAMSKATEQPRSECHFTRRQLRGYSGLSHSQIKVHVSRLVELEYLLVHHGKRGRQYVYELVYDGRGREGQPVFDGLLDVNKLEGQKGKLDPPSPAANGQLSGRKRPTKKRASKSKPTTNGDS